MYNDAYFSLNRKKHFSKGKLSNINICNDNLILQSKLSISEVKKIDLSQSYFDRYRIDAFGNIFIEDEKNIYLYDYNKLKAETILDKSIISNFQIVDYKVCENRMYLYCMDELSENYIIEYSIVSRRIKITIKTDEKNLKNIDEFRNLKFEVINQIDSEKAKNYFTNQELELLGLYKNLYEDNFKKIYTVSKNTIRIFERSLKFYDDDQSEIIIGDIFLPIINSRHKENDWYKLKIYAEIPEETSISIEYASFSQKLLDQLHINNHKNLIDIEEKKFEKLLSEIEFYKSEYFDELILHGNGQFMLIRLKFNGRVNASPSVDKIRVYYKKESYIKYLPEVYQNQSQKDFLERYLMIYESINEEIEELVDHISRTFDLYKCDYKFLKYIASWLSLEVDVTWSENKLRNLLLEYKDIYDYRGTAKFLKRVLEIYLDADITIVENSSINYNSEELTIELKEILYRNFGYDNFSITILCFRSTQISEKERNSISEIIKNAVPPYCKYNFVELYNYLSLTEHTYLGINTKISDISELKLNNDAILPFNTLLDD